MASLIIIAGPNEGEVFDLDQEALILGRGEDCQIQLVDERASRHHSRIVLDTSTKVPGTTISIKRYVVEDLGSSNGTAVNEVQVAAPVMLEDGQVISIGGTQALFTVRDFSTAEEAVAEISRIGHGTLADAATHWPMEADWKDERTLTD